MFGSMAKNIQFRISFVNKNRTILLPNCRVLVCKHEPFARLRRGVNFAPDGARCERREEARTTFHPSAEVTRSNEGRRILSDERVGGSQRQTMSLRLTNQHPVERVAMKGW